MIELDATDRAILRALVADATASAGEIGRELGLSQPAVWRRMKRLQEGGGWWRAICRILSACCGGGS